MTLHIHPAIHRYNYIYSNIKHTTPIRMSRISHCTKLEIIQLYDDGWKPYAIKKNLNDGKIKISYSGVKYIIDAYISGDFLPSKIRPKSTKTFKTLDVNDVSFVTSSLRDNCNLSARDLQKMFEERGTTASLSTIRRVIDAAGFTATKPRYCQLIRDVNKVKRVDFCKDLIISGDNLDDVIFTDECSIQLHDNKSVAYRMKGSIAPRHCRPKHPLKLHLWGGISKRGATSILAFDGIMCADFFTSEILGNTLLPFIKEVYPESHRVMMDNDPKHTSKLARKFMEDNNITWWKWPSESCDLNPIEMVWNELKRSVSKRSPVTKEQLAECVFDFWAGLTKDRCSKYIDHVYKVAPVVVEIGGQASGDIPGKLFSECSLGKGFNYFKSQICLPNMQNKLKSITAT